MHFSKHPVTKHLITMSHGYKYMKNNYTTVRWGFLETSKTLYPIQLRQAVENTLPVAPYN